MILRNPDPGRDRGLVVGNIKIYRANGLGALETQLDPRIELGVGGLGELDDGVINVLRVGRE